MSILDKWSRIIYKITTNYDPEGKYDTNYRELQRKLGGIRERYVQEEENLEEEVKENAEGKKKTNNSL